MGFTTKINRNCSLLVYVGLLLFSLQLNAATRYVTSAGTDSGNCEAMTSPCATISYAKSQSFAGDTVLVGKGTIDDGVITDSVTLDFPLNVEGRRIQLFPTAWVSCMDDQCPTITPPMGMRAFVLNAGAPVEIRFLTIAGARSNVAMRLENGQQAVIANTRFLDNDRGAIDAFDATHLTIEQCLFEGNSDPTGAAVFTTATLTIQDSTFRFNSAVSGAGGAIRTANINGTEDPDPVLTIERSTFQQNSADDGAFNSAGGAVATSNGIALIRDSQFIGNVATKFGGAVSFENTEATIEDSDFVDNQVSAAEAASAAHGGAINQFGGTMTIAGSLVLNNTTSRANSFGGAGAGISVSSSSAAATSATIVNSRIEGNESIGRSGGDGIWVRDPSVFMRIESSILRANGIHAGTGSGSPPGTDADLVLVGTTIVDGEFAPLLISSGASLDAWNSTISMTAPNNGLSVGSNASARLLHSTVVAQNGTALRTASNAASMIVASSVIAGSCARTGFDFDWDDRSVFDDASCAPPGSQISEIDLLPLGDYGGAIATHYLAPTSPAVDRAGLVDCLPPPINQQDQRGQMRPVGDACDAGAVEFNGELRSADLLISDGFEEP